MAALTTDQWIQIAVVGLTAFGVLCAVATVLVAQRNERKRTQPIVIANEDRPRHFADSLHVSAWVVDAHVKNEGAGPAFNVRFGVEFQGVRYPYKLRIDDPDPGNVQRVLAPSERRPSWPVLIDQSALWGGASEGGDPDPGRVYWARYEDAQGKVWETRNPGDRSGKLDIRRVHWVRFKQWREGHTRRQARKRGHEWEKKALEELRAGMSNPD